MYFDAFVHIEQRLLFPDLVSYERFFFVLKTLDWFENQPCYKASQQGYPGEVEERQMVFYHHGDSKYQLDEVVQKPVIFSLFLL